MNEPDPQDKLERYLDGLMSEQEAAEFLRDADPAEVEQTRALQSQMDDSLRRMIGELSIDKAAVEQLARHQLQTDGADSQRHPSSQNPNRRHWLTLALTACLLIGLSIGVWFQPGQSRIEPVDSVRQVAKLYQTKVRDGFRPYYVCDEPQRFAETFQVKLGQGLALATMPADRHMLGISYLGGVSRESVAMLAEVKDQPVMVFVDHEGKPGIEQAAQCDAPDLRVFVEKKHGLVFLEVTPYDSPQIIEYFQLAENTEGAD